MKGVQRRGRQAYSGTPLGEIAQKIGLAGPIYSCLGLVRLDGQLLMEVKDAKRRPSHFDPRPASKYDEAFAAAAVGCLIGLGEIEISSHHTDGRARENPDLLVTSTESDSVGVEVTFVDETAAARVPLYETQERVARFVGDHPQFKADLRFTLDYAKTGTLADSSVEQLASELIQFIQEERWKRVGKGRYGTLFADGTLAKRCGLVVEVADPTYATLLGFARADEMEPFQAVLGAIERKRRLIYDSEDPLWLVVTVRDPRGPFSKALEAVRRTAPPINPFVKVLVHDGWESVITLTAKAHS